MRTIIANHRHGLPLGCAVLCCFLICPTGATAGTCAASANPAARTLPPAPQSHATNAVSRPNLDGHWHSITVRPPPHLPRIHWYDKLNPVWWFKNLDDPKPPDWYKPGDRWRMLKWYCRNPFHNFDTYVIGIGDKKFVRSGRYPDVTSNPHEGWNFAVSKYKCVRLPFLSYRRGKFETYWGWRTRGNFGIKINIK